jgi:ribosomal protein S18 acetylase RimI-like enzyme
MAEESHPGRKSSMGWTLLPPELDGAAAALLAACPILGSEKAAAAAISTLRAEPEGEVYGWQEDDMLIAVYGLRRAGLSYELPWLAVAPDRRGQRFGRSALVEALRRCGRKPLTVQADEALKGWFEQVGFRIVGRRRLPDGGYRYRLGWYAPRRPGEPGHGAH